jgi:DNA-binding transcriptional ArsR family regulator
MKRRDILESKTRKTIYDCIFEYPGIHLRAIFRKLELSQGTIRYHIKYMKNRGLIIEKNEDGYIRFYVQNTIGEKEKTIINLLRKEVPRNIILYLLANTYSSQKELSKELEKDPKTINFHLKKLIKMEVVETATIGKGIIFTSYKKTKYVKHTPDHREVIYRLKDPYLIYDLLVTYRNKLLDNGTTDNVLVLFEWMINNFKKRKTMKSTEESYDRAVKVFYDIFPPPYRL